MTPKFYMKLYINIRAVYIIYKWTYIYLADLFMIMMMPSLGFTSEK